MRFQTAEEAEGFVMKLSEEVGRRLSSFGLRGQQLTLKVDVSSMALQS